MLERKITTQGNSAAITLSSELLSVMGLEIGDTVVLELMGRTLVVRPVSERDRARRFAEAKARTLTKYGETMKRLAEHDRLVVSKKKSGKK